MMWQSGHDVTKKRPREGKTKKQKQKKPVRICLHRRYKHLPSLFTDQLFEQSLEKTKGG